jgi:hypothetical protein
LLKHDSDHEANRHFANITGSRVTARKSKA